MVIFRGGGGTVRFTEAAGVFTQVGAPVASLDRWKQIGKDEAEVAYDMMQSDARLTVRIQRLVSHKTETISPGL